MGDVGTHKTIFERGVLPALQVARPNEDYLYVRLGNYLTDLSQVRDTLAYAMAKMRVWQKAQDSSWVFKFPLLGRLLLNIAGIPDYIEELLGKTTRVEDAALAKYLENLVRCFTILHFSSAENLPEQEVTRIYARNFTRYYPHEHLDFPPWPYKDPVGNRDVDNGARMLQSLSDQMRYLAESLVSVESAWRDTLAQDRGSTQRHDALADLGHTVHAIEDFYFHTNVLEIAELLRTRDAFPDPESLSRGWATDPLYTRGFWMYMQDHSLDRLPSQENSVRSRRRFFRRLKRPDPGDTPGTLSSITSGDAYSHVSTGGFGSTDIFHTLYGALAGLRAHLSDQQLSIFSNDLKIVLIKEILVEEEREKLRDEKYLDSQIAAHKAQLQDPDFDRRVDAKFAEFHLPASAASALKAAVALDRDLSNKYSHGIGIGGFLLSIAALLQTEHDDSEQLTQRLDQARYIIDGRTLVCDRLDDGRRGCASAETIGTHSLLSKDTEKSYPFRQRALAYATFVSGFFAGTMAQRMGSPAPPLDWRPALQQFLRYPHVDDGSWESQLLQTSSAPGDGHLDYSQLRERPDMKPFPADSKVPTLFGMQQAKRNLAALYDAEAEAATKEWQSR